MYFLTINKNQCKVQSAKQRLHIQDLMLGTEQQSHI